MTKIASMLMLSAVFSMSALAATWSGKLLDSSCYDKEKKADACIANTETTAFALDVNGKVYKFDAEGNTKAADALKNRADRATDPAQPGSHDVTARVTGTEMGGTITVESIDVR